EAFGLEIADVLRTDVVDGELKTPPERQLVAEPERPHFAGVRLARPEREEPRAAAVAERSVEGQRPGFAAHVELDRGSGEALVVGRQPGELLYGEALAHVP